MLDEKELESLENLVGEVFSDEPEEVQEAIGETIVPRALSSIIKKHNIPINKSRGFENYVYLILLNLEEKDELKILLEDRCHIDKKEVEDILDEVEKEIFEPIRRIRLSLIPPQDTPRIIEEKEIEDDKYREKIDNV